MTDDKKSPTANKSSGAPAPKRAASQKMPPTVAEQVAQSREAIASARELLKAHAKLKQ